MDRWKDRMTPAAMTPGIPYLVTRGSAALGLHRGDRIEVREDGALCRPGGLCWVAGWSGYSFTVEEDRAGIMERVADLRRRADLLEARL
jgi:hypothetical protein